MEKDIQTEVLTRLARIETKIDDYNRTKEKTDDAYNLSEKNKDDIKEIQDKIKFLSRTITTSIIGGIIGIVFIFIKIGMGVK